MKPKSSVFGKLIAGLAVVAMMTSVTQAAVLFSDTFSTDRALNGTAPEYVNPLYYPGGLTWQSSGASASGGTVSVAAGYINSGLAFTPVSGNQYLYEVVLTVGGAIGMGDQILGMGGYDWWQQDVSPTLLATAGGSDYGYYGPATSFTVFNSSLTHGGMNTMSWLLNATDANPANWTGTFSINGTSFAPIAAPAGIDIVGFGRHNNNYTFTVDSVSLSTVTIPEPTSGLLLIAGAAGLCLHRRRIRG